MDTDGLSSRGTQITAGRAAVCPRVAATHGLSTKQDDQLSLPLFRAHASFLSSLFLSNWLVGFFNLSRG